MPLKSPGYAPYPLTTIFDAFPCSFCFDSLIFSLFSSSLEGGEPQRQNSLDSSQIQPDFPVLDSHIIKLNVDHSPPPICSFVHSPAYPLSPAGQSVACSSRFSVSWSAQLPYSTSLAHFFEQDKY